MSLSLCVCVCECLSRWVNGILTLPSASEKVKTNIFFKIEFKTKITHRAAFRLNSKLISCVFTLGTCSIPQLFVYFFFFFVVCAFWLRAAFCSLGFFLLSFPRFWLNSTKQQKKRICKFFDTELSTHTHGRVQCNCDAFVYLVFEMIMCFSLILALM